MYEWSRRSFVLAGGAGLAMAAIAGPSQAQEDRREPAFEFIFRMEADLHPPQMIGATGKGSRIIFPAKSGTVEGPEIKATVLEGGGDWLTMRTDGVGELDVRGTMRTDDGALIYVHYTGLSHNQTADDSRYFVTTPRFETSVDKYQWLTKIVAVGMGSQPSEGKVAYDVFAIR